MKQWIGCIILLLATRFLHAQTDELGLYFSNLKALKFKEARQVALAVHDSTMSAEMIRMCDLLFYAGQADKNLFQHQDVDSVENKNKVLLALQLLNAGYFDLFYDRTKGNAYRCFYKAQRLSQEIGDPDIIKACTYAFLKYYAFEIAQNSNSHREYLAQLESLRSDAVDDIWITLHKMIFLSKSLNGLDSEYFELSAQLDRFEENLNAEDPLLAYIYYEKALHFYLRGDKENAARYYEKTASQSAHHPFLNTERFLSMIKRAKIAAEEQDPTGAETFYGQAKSLLINSDTLRSNYYLNLYGAMILHDLNKNDSAYVLLMEAYKQEFHLDFRRNTLEINQLEVELETREKENSNLRLREGRIWLITALLATGLIAVAAYFAYVGQRATNRMQARDAQMAKEKLLKEQELIVINSMLEGQEKERQRLANELHDDLGSLLTTLKFHFDAFRDKKNQPGSQPDELFDQTDKLLDEAYLKVRTIAHSRNAGVDPNEGLVPAVKLFAAKVSLMNSLTIEVHDNGMDTRLNNPLEITAFRIIQELITNIVKHAKATAATIHLTQHESSINVMIEDNGVGFDLSSIKQSAGMGLYSIQKRVEGLGGSVTIESTSKSGTTVIIELPTV
jgi:signal transduction histidine kinase